MTETKEDLIKRQLDTILDGCYSHLELDEENRRVKFRMEAGYYCTSDAAKRIKRQLAATRLVFKAEEGDEAYLAFYVEGVSLLGPSKWLFQLEKDRDPESDMLEDEKRYGITYVNIVSREFWEEHGYINDLHIGSLIEDDIPMFSGGEAMESLFEIKGTHEEALAQLKNWGMEEIKND